LTPGGAKYSILLQTGPAVHPASCKTDTALFLGGKERGVEMTSQPHLPPRLKKE